MKRPDLTPTARAEFDARRKHWPAAVAAGEMTQRQAEADIAAWAAIAELMEKGEVATDLGWADLVEAAQRAMDRRRAAALDEADGTPKRARLEQRFGDDWAIRRAIQHAAWRQGQCLEPIAA